MKERMEKQALQQVIIPENEIQWVKEGKELMLDGKMFDIRSIHIEKGIYYISGLFDDAETNLVKQLEKNQQANTISGNTFLVQFIQLFQYNLSYTFHTEPILLFLFKIHSADREWNLASGSVSVLTPPPQIGYNK